MRCSVRAFPAADPKRSSGRIRRSETLWNVSRRHYPGLMFAVRITLPHFSVSSAISFANSKVDSERGVSPSSAMCRVILESVSPRLMASCRTWCSQVTVFRAGGASSARHQTVICLIAGSHDHQQQHQKLGDDHGGGQESDLVAVALGHPLGSNRGTRAKNRHYGNVNVLTICGSR